MFALRYIGSPRVSCNESPPTPFAPAVSQQVEEIWAEKCARSENKLFNGPLFSVTDVKGGDVFGRVIPYKNFIAVRERPSLRSQISVYPLGVTGILHCGNGIVFGRRSNAVTQDPGCWEFIPSGGVDAGRRKSDGTIDCWAQLLVELGEEVGLTPEEVAWQSALCLVEDMSTHVFDIVIELTTTLTPAEVQARFQSGQTREYDEIEVIETAQRADFINKRGANMSPLTAFLLETKLIGEQGTK